MTCDDVDCNQMTSKPGGALTSGISRLELDDIMDVPTTFTTRLITQQNDGFPLELDGFPLKNVDSSLELDDFPLKNVDSSLELDDFPLKNVDSSLELDDFPLKNVDLSPDQLPPLPLPRDHCRSILTRHPAAKWRC